MQSLRDYLNESSLQYESILDPDQNKVMGRMTDDVIRNRIREYCTWNHSKYRRGELWPAAEANLEIAKIDKDKQGWYIETGGFTSMYRMDNDPTKSYHDYCLSKGQKMDKQKGFLIEDIGVYFRWRKHRDSLRFNGLANLESTDGLPEELDTLELSQCCIKSEKFDIRNKIKVIVLIDEVGDIKISGNGCKNVLIFPNCKVGRITVPAGVTIQRAKDWGEYRDLLNKFRY